MALALAPWGQRPRPAPRSAHLSLAQLSAAMGCARAPAPLGRVRNPRTRPGSSSGRVQGRALGRAEQRPARPLPAHSLAPPSVVGAAGEGRGDSGIPTAPRPRPPPPTPHPAPPGLSNNFSLGLNSGRGCNEILSKPGSPTPGQVLARPRVPHPRRPSRPEGNGNRPRLSCPRLLPMAVRIDPGVSAERGGPVI